MKIAYLARVDIGKESGVLKKISRQIRCWQNEGNHVKVFLLSRPTKHIWSGISDLDLIFWQTKNYLYLFLNAIKAEQAIQDWTPDLIYWRYSSVYPGLIKLIKKIPTIAEINSNYNYEYKAINRSGYILHQLTYRYAFKYLAGFVALTDELGEWVEKFGHPYFVLGDGIELETFPRLENVQNEKPQLVFIASHNFPWIALDKVIYLASNFHDWRFDIIGLENEIFKNKPCPENITFHGFLETKEYMEILEHADVAIGTLGLHRIGMNQMAPLKLREYLAFGLPVIIGYVDVDFPEGAPFILQLPNIENNIKDNLDLIKEFVHEWKGKRVEKEIISHLDIKIKEKRKLAFFQIAKKAHTTAVKI